MTTKKQIGSEKVQMVAPMLSLEEVEYRESLQRVIMSLDHAITVLIGRQDPPVFVNTLIQVKNNYQMERDAAIQHTAPRPASTVPKEEISEEPDDEGDEGGEG